MGRFSVGLYASLSLLMACGPKEDSASRLDFSSGEHVILGDAGYRAACANSTACPALLFRSDGKESFRYGELVAFSGDFYAQPDDIYLEKVAPFYQWHRNDITDVKADFNKEIGAIENYMHGHTDQPYPDLDISYAWNYPDYLAIALANVSHFGFYNMQAYVRYHAQALALAGQAHDLATSQVDAAERLLTRALFLNAFADHFLTDGFAAGHVRNPRVQILNWASATGLSDRAAGTLAKIIHDRDGEVRLSGEHGLAVSNAAGDHWMTRCDAQLFWKNSPDDPSVSLPIKAVTESVREVVEAYELGRRVEGVYAATKQVPFPEPGEPRLIDHFPADIPAVLLDQIMKEMPFYTKIKALSGVDRAVVKDLFAELPAIMQDFQNDVALELEKDGALSLRLPAAYRDAYRHIE